MGKWAQVWWGGGLSGGGGLRYGGEMSPVGR